MCDKCKPEQHKRYWIHLADSWKPHEQREMLDYLKQKLEET